MVPFVNVKISVHVNIAKIPSCHRAGQFECEYGLQCSFKREGNPCFTILTYEEFVVKYLSTVIHLQVFGKRIFYKDGVNHRAGKKLQWASVLVGTGQWEAIKIYRTFLFNDATEELF